MSDIQLVFARKILDSRGNATVEVDVWTDEGFGRAAAPSGASTGIHEVQAFPASGVDAAIKQFNSDFAPALKGLDVLLQRQFDSQLKVLDGTTNFSKMGGNVAVATSLAVAKAASAEVELPLYQYLGGTFATYSLPLPMGNVLGGGKHAVGGTDFQEYLVISFAPTIKECVFGNANVHRRVKNALTKRFPGVAIGKGDEGAWVARLGDEEALALVADCCKEASKELGFTIQPSLDIAASELFTNGEYRYRNSSLSPDKQVDFVEKLINSYNLYSVEDPLDQEDFQSYANLTERVGKKCIIIGDDLFVTNSARIKKGIDMGACNAVLIKPNQIGTLTETYEAVTLAHQHGYKTVISHRSGETEDTSIAHIGAAFGCHAIKTGVVGSERTAKLNELIRIEELTRKESQPRNGSE